METVEIGRTTGKLISMGVSSLGLTIPAWICEQMGLSLREDFVLIVERGDTHVDIRLRFKREITDV